MTVFTLCLRGVGEHDQSSKYSEGLSNELQRCCRKPQSASGLLGHGYSVSYSLVFGLGAAVTNIIIRRKSPDDLRKLTNYVSLSTSMLNDGAPRAIESHAHFSYPMPHSSEILGRMTAGSAHSRVYP